MNISFLNSIKDNNQTTKGREFLYENLNIKEKQYWEEISLSGISNWTQLFSLKSNLTPNKIVINEVDTKKSFTYKELEKQSENIKFFLLENTKEYQIGLNYHNSFLFLAALIGINKAGKLAVLFNNREPNKRQEELAKSSNTTIVLGDKIGCIKNYNIERISSYKKLNTHNFIVENALDDPAFVIFTSGTSGPSKGALFSHRRMIGAGIAWSLRTGMNSVDNCYIPLPLYHGNALAVAFSSVIYSNSTATIRIKFSTTAFFEDINQYKCTHMVYIGELWRYILNRYTKNENKYLKVIFGNGLNKILWNDVVNRYKISHVVEHFGATEMPAGALTNWFDISGYCGYLRSNDPKLNEMVLVDENYNNVEFGKYGEALFLVPSGEYKGYLDSSLDEAKLYRGLFKKGDLWWKSGDLLKSEENGFFTFIERLGDTYRFKGENVACVDVEYAIQESGLFEEVVVYGVELPGIDGKIGMVSLVLQDKIDLKSFLINLKSKISSHALPYIIKLEKNKHKTTTTLKIQKNLLSKDGIKKYKESEHFVLIDGTYKVLDQLLYTKILNSEIILGK